ncbi:hypothetical protein [Bacillus thermotolerans]|uniref:General stress protein n=1 Tax=Bacillus thermotolerans TaxID=1221996 RepID=A0A0F5I5B2_BACTR|nr:hypothetical protein [Bacillus thermotolerans]KKB36605.1 hypothetical protein QY97_00777 [Bacillus thermotolerans]KKB40643.1 hypothetical protein QY95_01217 [Bacillus thermotolerans]KKB43822.1 hypothetical protein QY96_00591 [Bacillus thermotolerans]
MKKKATKKLLHLWTGELTAAILFIFLWVLYARMFEWTEPYLLTLSPLYAFVLLEFILLQGTLYWFLQWRKIREGKEASLSFRQLRLFSFFKKLNWLLLLIGPLLLVSSSNNLGWFLFLYIFALVEQVNYYHIRLSYQSTDEIKEFIQQRGFRRSRLAKELSK